jgi:putative DNA primase/helicase
MRNERQPQNNTEKIKLLYDFLGAFFSEDEPIHIRAFKAKNTRDSQANRPQKMSITRAQLRDDPSVLQSLLELNKQRGVYFVVNSGGQSKTSIRRITAFFAESDDVVKSDQHRLLDAAPLKPSIRVETSRSVHAYWLIEGQCSVREWEQLQLLLISCLDDIGFRADATIKDASRVMRLPEFDHLSYDWQSIEYKRVPVKVVEFNTERRYTPAAMRQAFAKVSNEVHTALPNKELPPRILDGEGRHRTMVSLAGTLNYRGISSHEMLEMLRVVNSERCIPPLTEEKLQSIVNSISNYESANPICNSRMRENLTDLGNARRLVRLHGSDLRYDSKRGMWIVWDGVRWVEDSEAQAMRLAKDVPSAMIVEAASLTDEDRTALLKHAIRSESAKSLRAMLDLAKSENDIAASIEQFDYHPHLLNVSNGTIDLRSGKLHAHRREDMITKLVPIFYDESATATVFDVFLDRIFGGNQSLISFMQRVSGYSITGETGEQCMFMLHGTGANGKSTFLEIVAAVAAEYGAHVKTEALMKHKYMSAGAASEDIAELRGARFVSAVETNAGQELAESLLKQITGQDRVKARRLYSHNIEFRPTFKLWLACNHKPEIGGTDHAIWRRIHLIPFDVTIPENEREKRILEKLKAQLPGILVWFVQGASEYYTQGLNVPAEVKQATARYQAEQDTLSEFIDDTCTLGDQLTISVGEMYSMFETWCQSSGEALMSRRLFTQMMRERGFKYKRTNSGRFWSGLARRRFAPTLNAA